MKSEVEVKGDGRDLKGQKIKIDRTRPDETRGVRLRDREEVIKRRGEWRSDEEKEKGRKELRPILIEEG